MLETNAARYITSLRRSPRTREEYARDLQMFTNWASKKGKNDPRQITGGEIEEFLASLVRKDGIRYAAVTRNRMLAVLKGYFKFLVKDRLIAPSEDPSSMVGTQKRPRRSPIFLELDEGSQMILAVTKRPADTPFQQVMRLRDMAVLTLLLGSGLRISELVGLNMNTWREAMLSGWLTIVGKGDKERVVPPSDEAIENVQAYIRVRPETPPDMEGHPLFVSRKGGRLSRHQIERLVRSLAQEAGILKKITPHKLRATWVTQLLISGANPREIQKLAGHESLDTTMIYAGVRDNEELKRTIKRYQVRYM